MSKNDSWIGITPIVAVYLGGEILLPGLLKRTRRPLSTRAASTPNQPTVRWFLSTFPKLFLLGLLINVLSPLPGVWVSEIMLQQTRVEAVVPKWCAWMDAFPTVIDLARATPEEVNAQWAGLGFYARGRRLHQAAQQLVASASDESIVFPTTVEGWMQLPGMCCYNY